MVEIAGVSTLAQTALPTGVDGDRIARFMLQDGQSFGDTLALLSQSIAGLNQSLIAKYGFMMYPTDETFFEYEQGGSVTRAPIVTDLSNIEIVGGDTIGHMIAINEHGSAVGGSYKYFSRARSSKLISDVRKVTRRIEWAIEYDLINRLFVNTEYAVGSAGYNVGFVNGTAGNVDYTPPAMHGEVFANTHSHYIGIDSDTKGFDDAIEEIVEHLAEHGHTAPYELIVSRADYNTGTYAALSGYSELKPETMMVDGAGLTGINRFYMNGTQQFAGIVGHYNSRYGVVNIRPSSRVPANYLAGFKSYGNLATGNPLAVRYHPNVGFGIRMAVKQSSVIEGSQDYSPIEKAMVLFEYGVGVGEDRTNGAVAFVDASGAFSNPTVT